VSGNPAPRFADFLLKLEPKIASLLTFTNTSPISLMMLPTGMTFVPLAVRWVGTS
jgi:hypothetical protein